MAEAENVPENEEAQTEDDPEDRLAAIHGELMKMYERLTPHRANLGRQAREDPQKFLNGLVNIIPGTIIAGIQGVAKFTAEALEELGNRDFDHEQRICALEASPVMLGMNQPNVEDPKQLDQLFSDLLSLIDVALGQGELTEELAERLPTMREAVVGMQTGLYAVLGPPPEEGEEDEDETETEEETTEAEASAETQSEEEPNAAADAQEGGNPEEAEEAEPETD